MRYIYKRKIKSYDLGEKVVIKKVRRGEGVDFFGYYNVSPENNKGDIIYLSAQKEIIRGSKEFPVKILFKNNSQSREIGLSKSWNWQQGCMLQWLNDEYIIYNDYDKKKEKYVSKVINTDGDIIKSFEIAINNLNKNKRIALSLNYERLANLRPDYGYFNKQLSDSISDDNNGIWLLDLNSSNYKLIISLSRLKKLLPSESMSNATHKVNHIDINPSGDYFIFLHRWIGPRGRFTRLILSDMQHNDLRILNGDIMTSHCCWLNNNQILSYCYIEKKGTGYFLIDINTGESKLFSSKLPKEDGHPSISPDGRWLILDTYPDLSRFSKLYLFNIDEDELLKIGEFYQPLKYRNEMRVDLHPKWAPDSKSIYIESAHNNARKLYKLDIRHYTKN